MAKESKRVKSEAGKAMHSKSKTTRSLAGEVLRQGQKKRTRKRTTKRRGSSGKPFRPTGGAVAESQ